MSISQNELQEANATMVDFQYKVFFNKLASLGINPETSEEANALLSYGTKAVSDHPRSASKSASIEANGYSQEAQAIVDEMMQYPDFIKAASICAASQIMANQNATTL